MRKLLLLIILFFLIGCTPKEKLQSAKPDERAEVEYVINIDSYDDYELGGDYVFPTATCTPIDCEVTIDSSSFNNGILGEQVLIYKGYVDSSIVVEKSITVNIVDTVAPTVELVGKKNNIELTSIIFR